MRAPADPATHPLAHLIHSVRTDSELTLREVASRCGLSVSLVQMIETGVRPTVTPSTLRKLARGLGLDVAEVKRAELRQRVAILERLRRSAEDQLRRMDEAGAVA